MEMKIFIKKEEVQMKRKRIIAALLTGAMLCISIPITTWASDLDAVFDDGETAADFFMKILYESQNISMCPFFSQIDQIRFRKCFSDNSAVEEKIIKNIIEMTETV